ncbi:hypothetical protein H7097_02365 [Aeromicrobium sp.]|nr:hypothetical protein [Candidatus Saccharibacteria bacterium]
MHKSYDVLVQDIAIATEDALVDCEYSPMAPTSEDASDGSVFVHSGSFRRREATDISSGKEVAIEEQYLLLCQMSGELTAGHYLLVEFDDFTYSLELDEGRLDDDDEKFFTESEAEGYVSEMLGVVEAMRNSCPKSRVIES